MSAPEINASELEAFAHDLEEADLQPLWTQNLLSPVPELLSPHLWDWKRLKALAEASGRLVPIGGEANRRVLSLSHPDLGGLPFATHTLWAGIQFLNAGESATAHRHSAAALRFVLEGSGVWTLVNGDPVLMEPGDLVLTPNWSWHEHHNPGTEPMIWLDGTDIPLVRNLNAVFFEEGPEKLSPFEPIARSVSELLLPR